MDRIKYACEHIIQNENVIKANKTLWNEYKDKLLKQIVIMMNFDFAEIAKKFDNICKIEKKKKTEDDSEPIYNENELRRHYAFLHAMRTLGKEVNSAYYEALLIQNKQEEEHHKEITEKKESKEIKVDIKKDLGFDDYINELLSKKVSPEELKEYEKSMS